MRRVSNATARPGRLRLFLRRQRRFARPGLWLLASGAVVLGGVIGVRALDPAGRLTHMAGEAALAAGLRVTEVRFEGRHLTPEPLLRAAVGAPKGTPILSVSPAAIRARVLELAWVEGASVERRLPSTLIVRIDERQPFALWQNAGRFAVIDRDGRSIATDGLHAFASLPLVVGAGAPQHAAALLDALGEHPELKERVKAAVRVGERRWNLRLHNGADVMLPEGHEAAAIARLMEFHERDALLDRPLAAVDMRLPDRMVVRPKETPVPVTPARRPT